MRTELMNAMVLAYIGDAIFEVIVREYLVTIEGICKPKELQEKAITFVSATAQRQFVEKALTNNWLQEAEIDTYKRGRNSKTGKNETVNHSYSTGFEAVIGQLYLDGKTKRIEEIFEIYKTVVEEYKEK